MATVANPESYIAAPIQERFWLLHEVRPDLPLGNLAITLRLRGTLDTARLGACLDQLLINHASLRTAFTDEGQDGTEITATVLGQFLHCPCEMVDLTQHASREAALASVLDVAASHRFDLAMPPLLRATLVRLGAQEHVLLLVAHHIAVDGISMFQLLPAELCALYDARDPAPPPPPLDYAAFAQTRRNQEHGSQAARDLAYFQKSLAGAPRTLELPTDRTFPPVASMRGGQVERELSPSVAARVAQIARQLDVRPFDVMCGAFVAQLARYSGQLDLVLGTPVANRRGIPGIERLVGCCMDTQLLRLTFETAATFDEIVRTVHATQRDAAKHGALSFGRLLDALTDRRDPSRNAVYQVMFNYMGFSVADARMTSLDVQGARYPLGISQVDLSLDVITQASGYLLALEYNGDVFERDHAERLLGHYAQLLEAALGDPRSPLGKLPLLDAAERAQIEELAAGRKLPLPESSFFHDELRQRAKAHSSAIALRTAARSWSYQELFARAASLTQRLRQAGVQPGDYVALISIADPADVVCAILAVLGSGGAFLPLDGALPEPRLSANLTDCGARFCVSDWTNAPAWATSLRVVSARTDDFEPAAPAPPRPADLTEAHPAYVIYTSGSTGRPKGVIVSHRNLLHQLIARLERYDEQPQRLLAPYSFTFDSFLAGLSWSLATGGTLYLMHDESRRDPVQVAAVIAAEGITHLDLVPSMYAALLEVASPHELSTLRSVVCGGEALSDHLVLQHWRSLPMVRLFNEYGPTEATVFASVHEIARGVCDPSTPIGRAIPNAQCWVVDAFDALAPLGHRGELWIGGEGIALGYHGQPDQTAARFTWADELSTRVYRTGDMARYRSDGLLEFLGRSDDQIQVRGYRVEPAEIEAVLRAQPGVADAAVVLQGDAHLAGYVVAETNAVIASPQDLLSELRKALPAYMVPSSVLVLPSMPRTPNGKLDRAALPEARGPQRAGNAADVPRSDPERILVGLWEKLLQTHGLGVHDSFFEHGGHSLLAARLVGEIRARFGRRVGLVDLFREPTPAGIAKLLSQQDGGQKLRCIEMIRSGDDGIPLVFVGSTAQARKLAQHLSGPRSVYGLNMFGLYDETDPPRLDVPWMTEQFVREVRTVIPEGPYVLVGFCQDTKIACEMARMLRRQGAGIRLLALIDAVWLFSAHQKPRPRLSGFLPRAKELRVDAVVRRLQRGVQNSREAWRLRLSRAEQHARRLLGLSTPWLLGHRLLVSRYMEALDQHTCPALDDNVVVYVAADWEVDEAALQAQHGVRIRLVSGDHNGMFEGRQLLELAQHLEADLASVEA